MQLQARPSAVDGIVRCPGKLRACATAPAWMDEEGDNTVRDEGTACHHFAHQLTIGTRPQIGDVAPNGIAFDTDMKAACDLWLAVVCKWDTLAIDWELTIPIPAIGFDKGTPDAAAIGYTPDSKPIIYIADLKYGFRIVDVWPNYQLAIYAFAYAKLHGLDLSQCMVSLTIVQPRRWHPSGTVRSAFISGAECLALVMRALMAVVNALQPDAPLIPGKHCDYCPGRAECTALRSDTLDTVVTMPVGLPDDCAETELLYLRKYSEKLQAYMSGLEAQVEHAIKNGKVSSKFELRRSQGRKVWADPGKAKALANLIGVNIERPAELITPNQAFDAGMPAEFINQYATRGPGKITLEIADAGKWAKVFGK